MREDICTIPVTDVFQKTDGCPICRMQRQVEDKIITYIMGAAMMEPDVRTETNRQGFCDRHLEEMYSRNGKLQLALILESRIDELINAAKKGGDRLNDAISGCFVCGKVAWGLKHMFETIYKSYENDSDFRRMFQEQFVNNLGFLTPKKGLFYTFILHFHRVIHIFYVNTNCIKLFIDFLKCGGFTRNCTKNTR